MKNISVENIEEWFFDYHEGNLNDSEKKLVENFISTHPDLKNEFELWGEAVITAPLPEITQLQKKIKKPAFPSYYYYMLALVLLFSAALFFRNASNTGIQKTPAKPLPSATRIQKPPVRVPALQDTASIQALEENRHDVAVQSRQTLKVKQGPETVKNSLKTNPALDEKVPAEITNELPALSLQDTTGQASAEETAVEVTSSAETAVPGVEDVVSHHPEEVKNTTSKKELSKKEKKKLEEMKYNARKKRQEQEFLKGGKPYVVPTSDF